MEQPKAKPAVGRPRGRTVTHKASVYLTEAEARRAQELAARRGQSFSALMRELLNERARKEGLE